MPSPREKALQTAAPGSIVPAEEERLAEDRRPGNLPREKDYLAHAVNPPAEAAPARRLKGS